MAKRDFRPWCTTTARVFRRWAWARGTFCHLGNFP